MDAGGRVDAVARIGSGAGNTAFMTWNLLHLARIVKEAGGIPAHGNQRSDGLRAHRA